MKNFLLLVGLLLLCMPICAQPLLLNQQDYARMQTKLMQTSLKLTPDQVKAVGQINDSYALQVQNAIDSNSLFVNGESYLHALYNKKNAELRLALTPQQYASYVQMAHRALASQQPNIPTPEERAMQQTRAMATALQLSDAQVVRVEQINTKYAQQVQAVGEGSPELGGSNKEQYLQLFEQKNAELQRVLSAIQYEKYLELVKSYLAALQNR